MLSNENRKPRVLFIVAMGGLGGPVKRAMTLLTNLSGVERVLIKPRSRILDDHIHDLNILEEYIAMRRTAQHNRLGAALISAMIFARCLRRSRPIDVLHANGLVEFALCWPAAFFLRRPVVTWIGNWECPRFVKTFAPLFRTVCKRTSWNAVSSLAADVVAESGLAARQDVSVVTNIIDPSDIQPVQTKQESAYESTDARIAIGFLGVARNVKGFDLLAPAIEQLQDLEGLIKFLIYAPENDHPSWERLHQFQSSFVEIHPRTATVGDIYAICDIVFSPSRRESFNRVAAEALMSGTPVVASDLSPVREVVGNAGLFFSSGDAEGAAAQLRRLVQDEALRHELGRLGIQRSTRWLPASVAQRFEGLYCELSCRRIER